MQSQSHSNRAEADKVVAAVSAAGAKAAALGLDTSDVLLTDPAQSCPDLKRMLNG